MRCINSPDFYQLLGYLSLSVFCFLCWSMYWHSKNTVFKKSKKVSFHKNGQFGEVLKTVIRATRRSPKVPKVAKLPIIWDILSLFEPLCLILFYYILSFESSKGKLHRTLLFSYAQVELFSCCVASKLCLISHLTYCNC